jgi:hypothetical protein
LPELGIQATFGTPLAAMEAMCVDGRTPKSAFPFEREERRMTATPPFDVAGEADG